MTRSRTRLKDHSLLTIKRGKGNTIIRLVFNEGVSSLYAVSSSHPYREIKPSLPTYSLPSHLFQINSSLTQHSNFPLLNDVN
ncbi:hypothetical protein AQUCO_00500333v1 [Aquilegia coerulea]|uniref:Uncharacterized protein n=1 Tax=Aquilegia coerulea TaxID=218851 RepID=A0A2G5ERG2_AQUCA|nr:hypothetical protein AQUCO_00500333v1 [Aquilegia coerulea]